MAPRFKHSVGVVGEKTLIMDCLALFIVVHFNLFRRTDISTERLILARAIMCDSVGRANLGGQILKERHIFHY